MSGRKSGGVRRAVVRAAFVVLVCAAAGAAGRVFGGDWYWGGFAAAMVLIAFFVGRGARRPAAETKVDVAGRDIKSWHDTRVNVHTGGVTAVVGMVLIILVDGSELQRHTLSAQSPEAHVRLDIENARDLTITLDEGDFGPVQDRVTIREAVLLIGR